MTEIENAIAMKRIEDAIYEQLVSTNGKMSQDCIANVINEAITPFIPEPSIEVHSIKLDKNSRVLNIVFDVPSVALFDCYFAPMSEVGDD